MAQKDAHKAVKPIKTELPKRNADVPKNDRQKDRSIDPVEQAVLNAHDRGWK